TALSALAPSSSAAALLLAAPVLGRTAIVALMLSSAYVRKAGLGETLIKHLPVGPARIIIGIVVLVAVPVIGPWPIAAGAAAVFGVRFLAVRRLGGATGDVYGAAVDLTETAVLLAAVLNG
ncbi:MAG: adenosylcobinamide-GDP ribazoletransferase, partial [Gammaproteobacteria bacterium]